MSERTTKNGRPNRHAEDTIGLTLAVLTARDNESKRLRTRLDKSGGLEVSQIAALIGCSEQNVWLIYRKALAKLRAGLEARGVTAEDFAEAASRNYAKTHSARVAGGELATTWEHQL